MDRHFVRGNLNMLILSLLQQGPLYGLQVFSSRQLRLQTVLALKKVV